MNVQALIHSGLSGIAARGWQEMAKSLDRLALTGRAPALLDNRWFAHLAPCSRSVTGIGDILARGPIRFFAGLQDPRTRETLRARFPDHCQERLGAARRRRQGRFDLLGYRGLAFGDPIDWHLDPVSGKRAPWQHWSRIDPHDEARVGDSKVIWELNRQQWLLELGQAWRLTGNDDHARAFVAAVDSWMQANPPGMGINWARSLEVAYRAIAWSWALFLFAGSPRLTPAWTANLFAWLRSHALHVERYLSRHDSPNTHLTGEALGLYQIGTLFPHLEGAERWQALGERVLLEALPDDGAASDQATCYHRYTIEIYLHFLMLARRMDSPVPDRLGGSVQTMLDDLLAIRHPDGSLPQFGDSDGGWLLPLSARSPDDARGLFSVAAVLFDRADYAWAAGGLQPEVLWLFGDDGARRHDRLQCEPPAAPPSRLSTTTGRAVMRSSWEDDAHQLQLNAGSCSVRSGHGHADLLAINAAIFGRPILVDPGTCSFTTDCGWRNHFRTTAAHNTVTVDGESQVVPLTAFSWRQRAAARLCRWSSATDIDLVEAEHDAYRRLSEPVSHRRRIAFVKPHFWVLVDDLLGRGCHRVDLNFQFAPDATPEAPADDTAADGWQRVRTAEGHALLLQPIADVPLVTALHRGSESPRAGWVAPNYGVRVPAWALRVSARAALPLRLVTVLHPLRAGMQAPRLRHWTSANGDLRIELSGHTLELSDERIELTSDNRGVTQCAVSQGS